MTFTPEMTVAVRVMSLNRAEGWFSEERLGVLGIEPGTMLRLRTVGVAQYRQHTLGAPIEWAFTEIAEAIIDAVRA